MALTLSDDILRSFTNSLKPDKVSSDVTMFGEVKEIISPQEVAVQLDGSSVRTVATIAIACQVSDRVSVLIRDHKAIVTGNLTNPSLSGESNYIRILPDGSIVIGRLDDHGDPVGFYVRATDTNYSINTPSGETILNISVNDVTKLGEEIATVSDIVTDYEVLDNKPSIEGVELIGDRTFEDLSLQGITNSELENMLT